MTERRTDAIRAAACLLGMAAAAGSPLAQQSAVDRCREAPSDHARIACLERALAGEEAARAGVKAPPAPAPDPVPQPMHDREPAPESAPVPSLPPEAQSGDEDAPTGIGAEQVRARNETGAEREARLESATGLRVAAYHEVPYQRLQVELENGQIWRQIKGDTQAIRVDLDRNRTVDIEESTLGGYKLHLNEMRRTIRVERVK